jgi:sugar-specific transcriptional regulator TrmB
MLARHRIPHNESAPSNGASGRKGSPHAPTPPEPAPNPGDDMDPITGALVHLGLSVHEAQMFRSLLESGPSTARSAIEHSRLDRATGYRILSRLRARGLVTASGYRPQRFVALDATKLLDRVTSFWRDEIDLHRVLRDIYQGGLGIPARDAVPTPAALPSTVPTGLPRSPAHHLIVPGLERIGRQMVELIDQSHDEVGALLRPHLIPEPYRARVRASLATALRRNVRVRLVVDYHPPELDFLSELLHDFPEAGPGLEIRFFAPQLARLVVIDRRYALRCIHSALTAAAGPDLGIASDDFEFVRMQSGRFQSTWRESVPLEAALRSPMGSVLAPPSSSRELRNWVERAGRSELKGPVVESFGMTMPPRWMR